MVMAVDRDLDIFQNGLNEEVENGMVFLERVDDAVKGILRQKFRLGLFEHPIPEASFI